MGETALTNALTTSLKKRRKRRAVRTASALSILVLSSSIALADTPGAIPVMIFDGESGGPWHDWPQVTASLAATLDETELFDVDVVTAPSAGGDFDAFAPDFGAYAAIVMNYEAPDGRWPDELKSSLERYVRNGGGLVIVHAADNAFPSWPAYNEMIGVGGWQQRDERSGPYWYFVENELVSDTSAGPAGSHGERWPFAVTVREPNHPIMAGLPDVWMHGEDELYARLRGPGRNMTVLATAWSDPDNAGSGRHEPQLMVLSFGSGRVFHTTFGHDVRALNSIDSVVTLQRGTEWAASGQVTQAVPNDFPTAERAIYLSQPDAEQGSP